MQHSLVALVVNLAVQLQTFSLVIFAGHAHPHRERVADAHRFAEVQHLFQVNGTGARKHGAQQC